MNAEEFNHLHSLLNISSKELADRLKVEPGAISRWAKGQREIPDYIAEPLKTLVQIEFGNMELPLTLKEINALHQLAKKQNLTVAELVITILRGKLSESSPPNIIALPKKNVAEDEAEYKTNKNSSK